MMMMQAFPLRPVVARHCREVEKAGRKPYAYLQNQGPMSQHQDGCDAKDGQTLMTRTRSDEQSGNLQECSAATHRPIVLVKSETTTTTTTTSVRSRSTDCDHHRQQHHQEERETMSLRRSIFDHDTSSAAADAPYNYDFDLRGTNVGTCILSARSQNWNASSVVAPAIKCFNAAEISAACLLLEMGSSSYPAGDAAGQEQSQNQPCSSIRVSQCCGHAAPASLHVREISELASATSSGSSRDADDEVVGKVQETSAGREAKYSRAPRSLRLEPRNFGKKTKKLRKRELDVNLFRMNQEVLSADDVCDSFDKPTKKRHYKSIRALLDVK